MTIQKSNNDKISEMKEKRKKKKLYFSMQNIQFLHH